MTTVSRHFWKWLCAFVCISLTWAAIRAIAFDWSEVPTGSMIPTILIGDRIYVNKLAYDLKIPFVRQPLLTWSNPVRGDIVILKSPKDGALLVKRTVAIPGDHIQVCRDRVYVNCPTTAASASTANETPQVVPPGKYFVMGDNRDHSFDSRFFGLVDRERIVGKAVGVVLSIDPNRHLLPRWNRFLLSLN